MNITKVSVSRKFNLGNYETLDIGAEAELSEKETAFEVWSILKDNIEMYYLKTQKQAQPAKPIPQASAPTTTRPPVSEPQKTPAQLANEKQAQREAAAKTDFTKCPKCGANKMPQYKTCFTCYAKEKDLATQQREAEKAT